MRIKSIGHVLILILIGALLSSCNSDSSSIFHTNSDSDAAAASDTVKVPWDYRIVEGKVGDLIGSDMTVLPDNELLPNDNNYATGDPVWTLQYMDADITTNSQQKSNIHLSSWNTIKSFKDEKSAKEDLARLKVSIKSEVDLVGVYKTEYQEKTRNFAVITLPSGNRIKQPINDERYKAMKTQKKVEVFLEEVHDFSNYDYAYAKFRGWAK